MRNVAEDVREPYGFYMAGVIADDHRSAQAVEPAVATHWRALATCDGLAALCLIVDNHYGVARELGDNAFLARLELARHHVSERLPNVSSFPSYSALIKVWWQASKRAISGARLMSLKPQARRHVRRP
jgi:hypothetical protein